MHVVGGLPLRLHPLGNFSMAHGLEDMPLQHTMHVDTHRPPPPLPPGCGKATT